ncbi:MAG: AAA family ATPase [Clostridia bacterium]|nr:AAA family ATPase [Clostridia bacterium]
MKILSCTIENFGCLSQAHFDFSDGLNTVCERNGFGKTTLAVFIKAMLYGLPSSTKRDITENERRHYKPWQGGKYGGSLVFEAEGQLFRIERFFGAKEKDDTLTVYDLSTNKPTEKWGKSVGDALFDIDADGFERSIYISQRAPHADLNVPTLQGKLGSLIESSDDLGEYQNAFDLLQKRERSYKTTGERGTIYDIKREIAQKDAEILVCREAKEQGELCRRDILREEEQKRALQDKAREIKAENEKRLARNQERARRKDAQENYRRMQGLIEDAEAQRQEILAFFGGEAPRQEHLTRMEETVSLYESLLTKKEALSFPQSKQEKKEALRQKYKGNPPSQAKIASLQELLDITEQKRQRMELCAPRDDQEHQRDAIRYQGMDAQKREEILIATQACEDANTAFAKRIEAPNPLFWVGCIGALLFFALAIVFFLFEALVPAIMALVLLVGASLLAALSFKNGKGAPRNDTCLKQLEKLLLPFGVKPSVIEARIFIHNYDAYLQRVESRRKEEEAYAKLCQEYQEAEALCQKQFSLYGDGEAKAILDALREDLTLWEGLESDEKEAQGAQRDLEGEIERVKNTLKTLFEGYPKGESYRALLGVITAKLASLQALEKQIAEQKDALAVFCRENALKDEADTEEAEPLLDEAALSEEIERLTASIAAKTKDALLYEEKAFPLYIRIEERAALEERLRAADEAFTLLGKAKELLTQAKESLSSRYLSVMEQSFAQHMSLVSESPLPYHFDTELTLSAEKGGEWRQTPYLSAGEEDLALFCARIALVDSIFQKEKPVLILDDPFVNLDEENLRSAEKLLKEIAKERQIIYFVCRKDHLPA